MDAPLRLRLGHALDAVRAALPLEDGIRAVALDRERGLLEAAGLARARAEVLDAETAPLGVARERAVEIAGPQGGLVASDALADLDDHVLAVGRIGRRERDPQLLLERVAALLELGDELAQDPVAPRRVEIVMDLPPLLRQAVRRLELLQAPAGGRRLPVIVVDRRIGHALLRLLVRALELVDESFDAAGHSRPRVAA